MSEDSKPIEPKIDPALSSSTQKGLDGGGTKPSQDVTVKIDPKLTAVVQEQFQGGSSGPSKPEVKIDESLNSKLELSEKPNQNISK